MTSEKIKESFEELREGLAQDDSIEAEGKLKIGVAIDIAESLVLDVKRIADALSSGRL